MILTVAEIPVFVANHLEWLIAALVVVVGLLGFGASDLARFSVTRVWAISGVSFDESIRRKVLWITPLAILGVIVVSQLQRPMDEQDAIRQTTKFCLFATGMVAVITTVILACTNLPKEIENRVIFTVVTKPTTRLEIVLGKILGFARVSATILLIMGLFTLGYLHLRAWTLQRDIAQRLETGAVDAVSRPTLQHYADTGLMNAKSVRPASDVQFYARLPEINASRRWALGGSGEQSIAIPFDLNPALLAPLDQPMAPPGSTGMDIAVKIFAERRQDSKKIATSATRPSVPLPLLASTQPWLYDPKGSGIPAVILDILDGDKYTLYSAAQIQGGRAKPIDADHEFAVFSLSPDQVAGLLKRGNRVYLRITGVTQGFDYGADVEPARLLVQPVDPNGPVRTIQSARNPDNPQLALAPDFEGRSGTDGYQLRGDAGDSGPVAVFSFSNTSFTGSSEGTVPMELRLNIERGGTENDSDDEIPTNLSLQVRNRTTGRLGEPIRLQPESRRTAFFNVPATDLAGGNFEVIARCSTNGHWLNFKPISLSLVAERDSFAFNLLKSVLILWLLSILVITISIFCSTFLSWPIAIVLTLVILLGHWGVTQLGDSMGSGIGNQVANDIFGGNANPAAMKTVSTTVEALSKSLNTLAKVLPDIEQFGAVEDMDKGFTIPLQQLLEALGVLGAFGLPMAVLAFVFLKNKEVAP